MTQVTKAQQSHLRDVVAPALYDGVGISSRGLGRRTESQEMLDRIAQLTQENERLRAKVDESVRIEREQLEMNYWIVLPRNSGGASASSTYETFEQADSRARELTMKNANGADYVVLKTQYGYFRRGGA